MESPVKPLFDTLEHFNEPDPPSIVILLESPHLTEIPTEYQLTKQFLNSYSGSPDTFNTYRREVERLLQWAWFVKKKSLKAIDRHDIREYLSFVESPPKNWINHQQAPRFLMRSGVRIPNPEWRPFLIRTPKAQRKLNSGVTMTAHRLSNESLTSIFAVLSTFYTFLQQESYVPQNPIIQLRQKNRYLVKQQSQRVTRKLTALQWQYVIETAQKLAQQDPDYERHLFLLSAFYLLGLRISETAETPRRVPQMSDFSPDKSGRWWFTTVGKGNKLREVAVPTIMLEALKRFRTHLGLTPHPLRGEATPLVPKTRGQGGIGTRQVRHLIQAAFDAAIERLRRDQREEDAADLAAATVHWLRHTAISADVEHRPREHVRDDAGHENITVTDRYIEIDRIARHDSAKDKLLIPSKVD